MAVSLRVGNFHSSLIFILILANVRESKQAIKVFHTSDFFPKLNIFQYFQSPATLRVAI